MYLEAYYEAVEHTLHAIRGSQGPAIRQAGAAVAASLAEGGVWYVMDTGHLLYGEAFIRAGGLVAIAPFSYTLDVKDRSIELETPAPSPAQEAEWEQRTVALALDRSRMKKGDVILIGSNSGRTCNVIEVALQCRQRGVTTIGLSSAVQMAQCEAQHPSGKKLFDVVDIAIDNCGPLGDAAVAVKDNERICPMSGLAAAFILWAIQAEAVDRLQEKGIQPTIYRSVHTGGPAFVEAQQARYRERGI